MPEVLTLLILSRNNNLSLDVDTSPGAFFVKDVARITTEDNVEITKRDAMFKLSGDYGVPAGLSCKNG